jgi:hypothetical protein
MPEPTVQDVSAKVDLLAQKMESVESRGALMVLPQEVLKGADGKPQSADDLLGYRIATAPVKEAAELMKIVEKKETMRRHAEKEKADIRLRDLRAKAKIAMPLIGVAAGLVLTLTGFGLIGAVAIGAGLGLPVLVMDKIIDKFVGG